MGPAYHKGVPLGVPGITLDSGNCQFFWFRSLWMTVKKSCPCNQPNDVFFWSQILPKYANKEGEEPTTTTTTTTTTKPNQITQNTMLQHKFNARCLHLHPSQSARSEKVSHFEASKDDAERALELRPNWGRPNWG